MHTKFVGLVRMDQQEEFEAWEREQNKKLVHKSAEYFNALHNRNHPKHVEAMQMRAERMKIKSVPFVEDGELNLLKY